MGDQAETLDIYRTTCMLIAEATIHSHNTDDFSPKKVEAADMEKFWKLALQANRNNAPTPKPPMKHIMSRYPKMDTAGLDKRPTIIHHLKQSKETYRDAIAKGKELCHAFLLEKAEIAALNNSQTQETAIKQLVHIKASIQTHASIKRVMHLSSYEPGLTSIQVPTDNGSYRTVIDSKDIEYHHINRNCKHYAQAEHTAMAHHLIQEKLVVLGATDFCDQVLAGMADLSNLPITLQAIFQQLHQPHSVDISTVIEFDDFKDALHRWKETSSTSPSGRHLGHYISLLKNINNETDEIADSILQLHHTMLLIAQY
jgi:hypothetical protein